MNDFREALGQFCDAIRQEGERSENPGLGAILKQKRVRPPWAAAVWPGAAWAAAALLALALGMVPAYQNSLHEKARQREAEQAQADELLMEQVNAGLSRSVPRAMAPLVDWVPWEAGK
ncbi:MAG TPA: hypothetical protein VGG72_07755 [Bryobacteraceae bacterium]|jgi:hypothetical protein